MNRRDILKAGGSFALNAALVGAGVAAIARPALAAAPGPAPARAVKQLALVNTHTGDAFNDAFWENGTYVPDAMRAIEHVMRDHRSGDAHAIDPGLLDQLVDLRATLGARAPYQIISGYRSPATNAMLHENSNGVATRSLHMDGRAIDVRVQGVELTNLRDAALRAARGGVGYYASSDFVHLDTGRVRRW